jgi:hypothetical protein
VSENGRFPRLYDSGCKISMQSFCRFQVQCLPPVEHTTGIYSFPIQISRRSINWYMGVWAERKTDSAALDSTTCPLYMTITLSTTCEKTYKSCLIKQVYQILLLFKVHYQFGDLALDRDVKSRKGFVNI